MFPSPRLSPLALAAAICLPGTVMAATVTSFGFDSGYADNAVFASDGIFLKDSSGATSDVVSLSTPGTNTMSVEQVGSADTGNGFLYDSGGTPAKYDVASPLETASSLGSHFLRTTTGLTGSFVTSAAVFRFDFAGGVAAVSGELWDIDGNTSQGSEAWRVVVILSGGGTVEALSPVGTNNKDTTSLDGQSWRFSFARAGNEIEALDFHFVGSKTTGIGAAFDNLTITQVPLPTGALLLGGALIGLVGLRRRLA
ncbi:hypothetical protein [Jannaschia formosa]|uniref:hypothetical protein n=1 Tax=Jannaschia formosa TaxID=2259592 RepID=UPI000E1B76F1|nr:hypothetical protein [Jannaschia formosa]TFL17640.1 hypothetical protein DR046_13330 [Jannaschia formosa]